MNTPNPLFHSRLLRLLVSLMGAVAALAAAPAEPGRVNLLVNAAFNFHAFENSRRGEPTAGKSGAVPGWDQEAYRDCEVWRAPGVAAFRPGFPVEGVVVIHPGKRLSQFILLAEAGLDPGERVSLSVFGHQAAPDALRASILSMQVDGAAGEWSPGDSGQADKRTFVRAARGELIPVPSAAGASGAAGDFELRLANVEIAGPAAPPGGAANEPRPMTIGVTVEFRNGSDQDVWIYAPCLAQGPEARNRLPAARSVPALYRHIPRTMQKLWRGEPLHILHAGYSSDAGDANPPLYFYDENPQSPTFKAPQQREFDGTKIGRPEWNDYYLRWNFYFMAWGRMRTALLRNYDLPIDRVMLNSMTVGGSFLVEAHSAFAEYATLANPPGPTNGHRAGKTWRELYPDVMSRPGGPGPDLVVFGYGARFARDAGADEVEQYEGAIRWFQRHYPGVEFILSINDWKEGFAGNSGALRDLALRYGIPVIDFGRALHLSMRHYDGRNPMAGDAHPQAYAHYLWYREIARAFEAVDPIEPGLPQAHLPERISGHSIGWEGELRTFTAPQARLRGNTGFILEDTTFNIWATGQAGGLQVSLDGKVLELPRAVTAYAKRDSRNSTFAGGRLSLGDRHVVEISGPEAKLVAADAKTVNERQWIGVESPRWQLGGKRVAPFSSQWGAPYGAIQVEIPAGESIALDAPGTFFSIAYVDRADGGQIVVEVDGNEALRQPANVPFRTVAGEAVLMENRRGVGPFPYGLHTVRLTAAGGPVAVLGIFGYDTRSNRANERVVRGTAHPGETISLEPAFQARPLAICSGGLRVAPGDLSAGQVTFTGEGPGTYELVGQ